MLKQWIVANFDGYKIYPVLGDWLRVDFTHNGGALFGLFQGTAPVFAVVTVFVMGFIALLEVRWGWHSWLLTLALGLLLGGAVGNLIDRIRLGYVVDFVDIGIGSWRFYIFNIADMAVSCFFLLLIAMWIFAPGLLSLRNGDGEAGAGPSAANGPRAANGPSSSGRGGSDEPYDAKGPAAE